ncbi:MAG: hypothetical protein A3J28_12275 [Acidobacteria bacterium RIFCSPLOWO2_12_FULL_60_22]|nr:MAG: hypothetical protein A3J28_12275 [Acidobacteria bacterium RIFCSPLOWO2_12_FULL_60_22]
MESRKPAVKDYYAALGVSPEATQSEIKKAYRALAQRYHPDRVSAGKEDDLGGVLERTYAFERMIEINEAIAVLSDKKLRAAYDEKRTAPSKPAPAAEPAPAEWEMPAQPTPTPTSAAARNPVLDQTVRQDFLGKLKALIAQQAKLREEQEKPWLWSFQGKTWGANHWVSLRSFPVLNPSVAREIVTQVEAVVSKRRSGWKNNFFVFILAFQSLSEGETVLKICRTYCNREENSTNRNLVNLIALDLSHRRSVLCGKRATDPTLDQILFLLNAS